MLYEVFSRGLNGDKYVTSFHLLKEAKKYIYDHRGTDPNLFIPSEDNPAKLPSGKTIGTMPETADVVPEGKKSISGHMVAEAHTNGQAVVLYVERSDGIKQAIFGMNEGQVDVLIGSLMVAKMQMQSIRFANFIKELGKKNDDSIASNK